MQTTPREDVSMIVKYRLLVQAAGVILVILVIAVLTTNDTKPSIPTNMESSAPPPMTALMTEVLEKSTGFQHLVSYTDHGFEPPALTIKKGEVIRFTNNSTRDLWIASSAGDAGRLYPGRTHESCGQSGFDSCVSLKPMEFWEFKFDATGEWEYRNNATPDNGGVIRVQ